MVRACGRRCGARSTHVTSAPSTIDSLLKRNDFNLQVMATVPALCLVSALVIVSRTLWRKLRSSDRALRDPKRNAKDVLGHRKTYVVVRVGEPPRPPREPADGEAGEEGEEPEPEAGPDPDALVPLTFELPADPVEPVEEPAAEPVAEEGAE